MSLELGTTKEEAPASMQARVQEAEMGDKYLCESRDHGDGWGPDFPGQLKIQTGTWQDFQEQDRYLNPSNFSGCWDV